MAAMLSFVPSGGPATTVSGASPAAAPVQGRHAGDHLEIGLTLRVMMMIMCYGDG